MTTMSNRENQCMKLCEWIPIDKLDWMWLSENPNAIQLLEKNLDEVNWSWLSMNPNAIPILEKNLKKVHWSYLYRNPIMNGVNRKIR